MKRKFEFARSSFSILMLLIFLFTQSGLAQSAGLQEPQAGADLSASAAAISNISINPLVMSNSLSSSSTLPDLVLPEQADWKDAGIAIREGAEGSWDRYLWGGFANSLVKKGNTYFLYYQGSPYYDSTCESVAYRAIGVATSTDGINWTKHQGNPVVRWSSRGSVEEGAASAGAWLGSDGNIYLYYGANSGTGCLVDSDGRLAVSSDGLNFKDAGRVLSGMDSSTWGFGDEVFPVGAYQYQGAWNMFYIPNGTAQARRLGVAIGSSPTAFSKSSGVNSGALPAWGTVSTVLNQDKSVLFVNDGGTNLPLKAYRFNASAPASMTLEKTYLFSDCARFSVLHDAAASRWLMLCSDRTNYATYKIKIASQQAAASPTPGPTATVLASPTAAAPVAPTPTRAASPTPIPVASPTVQVASLGSLSGTISSSAGGVLPGIKVVVSNQGTRREVSTDAAGQYRVDGLAPGSYSVRYSHAGYHQASVEVTIQSGAGTVHNLTLNKKKR